MSDLADLIFQFRERAAIREFCGNETRNLATYNAANEIRREYGLKTLPAEILREVGGVGVERSLLD